LAILQAEGTGSIPVRFIKKPPQKRPFLISGVDYPARARPPSRG